MAELQTRMSSAEFAEWMAYSRVEPFGQDRQDIGAAIVAATVANVHRNEDTPAFRLSDFLPSFEPPQQQTWQDQLAWVEMLNAAYGGKDERS